MLIVSHDLQGPRSVMKSAASLLDEHAKSVSTPVKRARFDAVGKARQTADAFLRSKVVKAAIHPHSLEKSIMVELDEMRFTKIFNNLLTNSIKLKPPVGNITINLTTQDTELLLTHAETGIGIPQELQPYLFEKHSNRAARRGLKGGGSERHGAVNYQRPDRDTGGANRVESEENRGTTCYTCFPLLL